MSRESANLLEPTFPSTSVSQTNEAGQAGTFAPVICYCQAGEPPIKFEILVRKKFFLLVSDYDFLNKTAFLEAPFRVYDSMAGQFISILPSAFWRFPSPINPFYIVKDGRIQDCDCPDLPYYLDILSGIAEDYFEVLPWIRSSSPLPPSSPPPPIPPIEYADKETQTTEGVNPKKRKEYAEVTGPTGKIRRTTKFEVNLHIHCDKDGYTLKKGTSNSLDDPIVV